MTEWRKDVVHSCYGCKMYYPKGHPERVGKPWSVIDTEEWEDPYRRCARNCKDYWRAGEQD